MTALSAVFRCLFCRVIRQNVGYLLFQMGKNPKFSKKLGFLYCHNWENMVISSYPHYE